MSDEPGDCIIREVDGKPVIEQADKRILISRQFLDAFDREHADLSGNVLTLYGSNRTVRYRLDLRAVGHFADVYPAERIDEDEPAAPVTLQQGNNFTFVASSSP